jgi:hypothetical protein
MRERFQLRVCGIAAIVLVCVLSAPGIAGPSCNVQHELLGFTIETDQAFWIAIHRTGDCVLSTLLKVVVSGNSLVGTQKIGYSPNTSKWAASLLKLFKHEEPVVWSNPADDWIKIDSGFSIRQPQPSHQLLTRFKQWDGSAIPAWYWNKQEGVAGIDLPAVRGDDLELVYADSVGLYVNYRFQDVYYFQHGGYLLITTLNDRYAGEFDSENGFLLLRRKSDR